jgi:dihydrofolate synthase/folylpolyglutamate synthase
VTVVERLQALEQFGIKLGLDGIGALTTALGRPQDRWPSIHVAGTNGKGSVTAMCERALRAAGFRTGWYTSPHLARLEERFRVDGEEVGTASLESALGRVFDGIDRLRADGTLAHSPTFFEATTAAAFLLFADAGVDVGVIEVGLGGRFDATNVLTPATGAITTIQFDHERHLGSTLEAIAFEKAGIAKRGVPLVVGDVAPGPAAVIARVAAERGAPLVPAREGVRLASRMDGGHAVVEMATPVRAYPPLRLGLAGAHQVDNALVAVRTLEAFAAATGRPLPGDAVALGLTAAQWPARLEWLRHAARGPVLLDAAHNPSGAAALARYLADSGTPPLPFVVSIMQDKDARGVLAPLLPHVSAIVATRADSPRAMDAAALAGVAAALAGPSVPVEAVDDPDMALARAARPGAAVLVAGSIFLVGPLRARLLAGGYRT